MACKALVILLALAVFAPRVDAGELTVATIRVGDIVLKELGSEFERASGHTLRLTVDLAPALARKIEAGEPFDVAILAAPQMMSVPGVQVVGPLPAEIQSYVTWTAGVSADTRQANAAHAFIDFLRSEQAARVTKAKGLERP